MSLEIVIWSAMAVYGAVMYALSPRADTVREFFGAEESEGGDVTSGLLIGSVVISWLFAKSITNAANLGAEYGLVGAVAYSSWYLTIPVVGVVIYQLRETFGARSLSAFVVRKYGRWASFGFLVAVSIRLFNEVWSNTAVVAAYFGANGSGSYYLAAAVFGLLTLGYSLRGGLRSSILTDAFQCGMAVFLLVFALGLVLPETGGTDVVESGSWTLRGGVDLLLVGILQAFSYGFHDPVLTDRGFITEPGRMLKGYLIAGGVAALFIVLFGVIGIHAYVGGIEVGQDAPLRVAETFGVSILAGMSVMMMLSAGSTLDSTLSSFSKAAVGDFGGVAPDGTRHRRVPLPNLAAWLQQRDPVWLGRMVMVGTIVVGSVPLFSGAEILQATTISGTMVLGLAPVFLLAFVRSAGPAAFHLAFWPGVALGVAHTAGWRPDWLAVGTGDYAALLGVNLAGTAVVFTGFALGTVLDAAGRRGDPAEV